MIFFQVTAAVDARIGCFSIKSSNLPYCKNRIIMITMLTICFFIVTLGISTDVREF